MDNLKNFASNDISSALLALTDHGLTVFGTKEKFSDWMKKENFFFDKKAPMNF